MGRNELKSFGDTATFLDPLLGRPDISSWLLRPMHRICKSPFLFFHIRFLPGERGLFFFFKSRVICSLESILDKAMFKLPLLDTSLPAHPSPLPSPAWCCGWTNGQPWASLNPGTRDICDNMMGSEAREDYHLLTTLLAVSVYFITLTLSDFSKPRQRTVGKL